MTGFVAGFRTRAGAALEAIQLRGVPARLVLRQRRNTRRHAHGEQDIQDYDHGGSENGIREALGSEILTARRFVL